MASLPQPASSYRKLRGGWRPV